MDNENIPMKKRGNPVAKFAGTFNKSTVQVDRKRQSKRGYTKHKKPDLGRASSFSEPRKVIA